MMLTPRRGKLEWRQHSQWHLTGQNKTPVVLENKKKRRLIVSQMSNRLNIHAGSDGASTRNCFICCLRVFIVPSHLLEVGRSIWRNMVITLHRIVESLRTFLARLYIFLKANRQIICTLRCDSGLAFMEIYHPCKDYKYWISLRKSLKQPFAYVTKY